MAASTEFESSSYWIRAFKHESFLGQALPAGDAGKTLRDAGAAAVPVLCDLARSPQSNVRMDGLLGLSLLGPEARAAQQVLAEEVAKEKESAHFLLGSRTLGKLDPAAATEVLQEILRHKEGDDSRRSWALEVLLELTPECWGAIPVLNDIALDAKQDVRLRVAASRVLTRLHQPAEPLIGPLCEAFTAQTAPAGVQALQALGEMGTAAAPAIPTLLKLLQRSKLPAAGFPFGPPHRQAVVICLGEIGPPARSAVPALITSLESGNDLVRIEVARALTHILPRARETLAARDAVWATSLAMLAASKPGDLSVPLLAEIFQRTWIPGGLQTHGVISEAIYKIDPSARARVRAGALKGN